MERKSNLIKRIVHIVLSVWMAIVLLFGSTPKEFVHLFADHTDTVHCHASHDGLVIENEHHHCSFLSFTLTPFTNDISIPFISLVSIIYPQYEAESADHLIPRDVIISLLRGPPVA